MDHLDIIKSPGGNCFNFTTLRITKFNRTSYIVKANFVQVADSMNDISVELVTYLEQGNEYKLQPYKILRKPLCDAYKNEFLTYMYFGIKSFSNLPEPSQCPWPKVYEPIFSSY